MSASNAKPTNIFEREIVSTRLIDASRELVFKAWTDPSHLVHWWGPKDFTNTFHEFDPTPGGRWRFVMHGPDGRDYKNEIIFVEVIEPELVIFDHTSGPAYHGTATFNEEAGKTRVTYHMLFETEALQAKFKTLVVSANEELFDRLEFELQRMKGTV